MFPEESNKMETYTYVRTKKILNKYKSLNGPIYFEIFTFFFLWTYKERNIIYIYIYIYII